LLEMQPDSSRHVKEQLKVWYSCGRPSAHTLPTPNTSFYSL
jgi:hypothetical protein